MFTLEKSPKDRVSEARLLMFSVGFKLVSFVVIIMSLLSFKRTLNHQRIVNGQGINAKIYKNKNACYLRYASH